ncbi:putative quinate dehydrogenase [[Candida] railenensis]|uniref:Quinate dehydrogenase n=1 Tax=[Candida] railenensis TaxID=45579 RepID=A0A9P0VYT2_9ASCO|nr:putative quinate dehydrogenase [[Candida] railenensis]
MTIAAADTDQLSINFEKTRKQNYVIPLFGVGIQHSRAPLIHNYLFEKLGLPWKYILFDSKDIGSFKSTFAYEEEHGAFYAAAVTMPNKIVMVDHVDHVDDGGKAVGAINTIYSRLDSEGKQVRIGTNTDTIGIRDAFVYNAPELVHRAKGKPGLVYGGGGACRSAVYALSKYLHSSKIYVVNRFESEILSLKESMEAGGFKGEVIYVATPEQAASLEKPELIVCTIPDFAPSTEDELRAKATLDVFMHQDKKGAVLEMCYHPKPDTKLCKEFESSKWQVISGIEAMVYQAFAQQVLWTGYALEELPLESARKYVYEQIS